ncbi:MAG: FG-GAP repeat protein, partial [Candidatus Hydrogenedentes bacterium]|nr:FG-GAP repeat protein [Candidatus Hydrogenedentota bacterium]
MPSAPVRDPGGSFPPPPPTTSRTPTPEAAIPSGNWLGQVEENIRKAEYHVTSQEKCAIEGMPGGLHAANRAKNLRAYFREDGVQIVERETDSPQWDVRFQFTAWGRHNDLRSVPAVVPVAEEHTNRVKYVHSGLEEWYVNSEDGLEHGFAITERPAGEGKLLLEGAFSGKTQPRNGENSNTVEFANSEGEEVLTYTKLVVVDRRGTSIPARMRCVGTELNIMIDDSVAEYPLTVDPLYVPPPIGDVQIYGQEGAGFGYSVSTAGDVNGDGYADVIVGAPTFDHGENDEGAVFLFLGSPSGLIGSDSASAANLLESNQAAVEAYPGADFVVGPKFGVDVSGAGDVNGDGYSDIIVGAPRYENGQDAEGAAFVFLGSPAGLLGTSPTDAAVVLESNQPGQASTSVYGAGFILGPDFGAEVSGIGDVNGDGYADVMVGAPRWDSPVAGQSYTSLDTPIPIPDYDGAPSQITSSRLVNTGTIVDVDVVVDITHSWRGDLIVKLTSPNGATVFLHNLSGGSADNVQWTYDDETRPPDGPGTLSDFDGEDAGGTWTLAVSDNAGADVGTLNSWSLRIVYADNDAGAAFVFLGSNSGVVGRNPTTAAAVLESEQAHANFGRSVSGAGTVNGDTYGDIVVSDSSGVYVFHGSANGIIGADPNEAATFFAGDYPKVAQGGDVNGDGYSDVLIQTTLTYEDYLDSSYYVFWGSESGVLANSPELFLSSFGTLGQFPRSGISGAGDANGDGYGDVVISTDEGVFLYRGSQSGVLSASPVMTQGLAGPFEVSGAGDVNGDGLSDVLLGAPWHDRNNDHRSEGAAFVVFGSMPGIVGSDAADPEVLDGFARQAGDINGDGYGDVTINANVLPGSPSGFAGSSLGIGTKGIGDVNGDGYGDVVVLATDGVFVLPGSASGVAGNDLSDAIGVLQGSFSVVEGAGDVNGDGYADVIVGAPNYANGQENEGAAILFLGSLSGLIGSNSSDAAAVLESNQSDSMFGSSVSGAGDVNGDGYADVIVGAHRYDNGEQNEGSAFVFLGSASGIIGRTPAEAWAMLESDISSPEPFPDDPEVIVEAPDFGFSVSGCGDVNGDDYADVIVGAPRFDNGEYDEGAAFVFYGSASALVGSKPRDAGTILESNQASAHFGGIVSSAGDINGDGYADIIVKTSNYPLDEDFALVFRGSQNGIVGNNPSDAANMLSATGIASYSKISHLAAAGDVNGDGYGDVIISMFLTDDPLLIDGTDTGLVFYGGTKGVSVAPRLTKAGGGALATPGIHVGGNTFRLQMTARAEPLGPSAVRLEIEVKPYAIPFDGTDTSVSGSWLDVAAGHALEESFTIPGEANGFRWRARALYAPLSLFNQETPLTVKPGLSLPPKPAHSRWYYPHWATVGPSDFRTTGYRPPTDPGQISVSSSPLYTTNNVVCSVGLPGTSPAVPPKPIQHEFRWNNGVRDVVHVVSSSTDTLSSSETSKHEIWTCTVRAYDGVSYSFESVSATAPEILNTPPGAPILSYPTIESDGQNLVYQITEVSADPDIDPIQYDFDWYVKRQGQAAFSLFRDGSLSPAISSQINLLDTTPEDLWYVVVRPYDGEVYGTSASNVSSPTRIVAGGVIPSFISLGVTPSTVKLGQAVTALGQIFPNPGTLENVAFTSTSPSCITPPACNNPLFPSPVGIGVNGAYSRTFYPTQASEGRSPWKLKSSWDGNNTYQAATSDQVSFEVLKAEPTLTISVSASAVPLNLVGVYSLEARATFRAQLPTPLPSELSAILSNRPIRLSVGRLAQGGSFETVGVLTAMTDVNGLAVFDLLHSNLPFGTPGTWQFRALFDGDNDFRSAVTSDWGQAGTPRLTIKDKAGYAVLVVGKYQTGEGLAGHAKTGDFVYLSLVDRGFAPDDIYYLRERYPNEQVSANIQIDDETPTQADIAWAISQWPLQSGRMLDRPAPLYVVFIDHGGFEKFYVYSSSAPVDDRIITPGEVDGFFRALELGLPAPSSTTDVRQRIFIYGACRSGSFIPVVSAPGRIVITSTATGQFSYRGVEDPDDGVRDGEAFVTEFFRNAREGKKLKESFELASAHIAEYTAESSNGATGQPAQTPLLDDNADHVGTAGTLSLDSIQDGARAHTLELGVATNAPGAVGWFQVRPTVTLPYGVALDELWAEADEKPATGHEAWIEVKTPYDYSGGTPVDPGFTDSQQTVDLNNYRFPAEPAPVSDPANGIFRWRYFGTTFDTPGTYKVFYFIRDGASGNVGAFLLTTVYRLAPPDSGNRPPLKVTLIYPENDPQGLTPQASTTYFAWQATSDLDGHAFTYRLEITPDPSFETVPIFREHLTTTLVQVEGLDDPARYYWRVIPIDELGASPLQNDVWTFEVDSRNPPALGALGGSVYVQGTASPIAGADIVVTGPESITTSSDNFGGFAVPQLTSGSYTVTATHPDYDGPVSVQVYVPEGQLVSAPPLYLAPKPPSPPPPPVITVQPVSKTVNVGQPVQFNVTATGAGPLGYQWKKNGTDIPGATGASYAIASAQHVDEGSYTGVVSNSGGQVTSNAVTLSVNETPTDLGLSPSSFAENLAFGATVGALSTTDPDTGNTFTYTLVSGTGGTSNASFTISGNTLKTAAVFNYEAKNSYSVRVRTADQGGLFYEEAVTITVTNVNEAPTDLTLSASSVAENLPAGTNVGALSTSDPDTGNTFTYTLVSGTGSTDNASFTITGNTLKTAAVFNYEVKNSYSIRLRTTDQGGLFYEEAATITVTNVNEAPTDLSLSPSSVTENLAFGTNVGTLSTSDPDTGNTFTYTLVSGTGSTDNASFTITGNTLKTAAVFNYEVKN